MDVLLGFNTPTYQSSLIILCMTATMAQKACLMNAASSAPMRSPNQRRALWISQAALRIETSNLIRQVVFFWEPGAPIFQGEAILQHSEDLAISSIVIALYAISDKNL